MAMITMIKKRDGRQVPFNIEKIANAIFKAAQTVGGRDFSEAMALADKVCQRLSEEIIGRNPSVEEVQDMVEKVLVEEGHAKTAKAYILYRADRTRAREMDSTLMKIYEDLTFKSASDCDIKRENANIDGDTAMGTMLKYGSEGAKQFNEMYVLDPKHSQAHINGDIHIHDLDFLTLTTTCCQIDLLKLFHGGFSTGHGYLREPNDISSYAALACIAIQSNQNDQHGGQSVPNFDYAMAEGVKKTFRRLYTNNLAKAVSFSLGLDDFTDVLAEMKKAAADIEQESGLYPRGEGMGKDRRKVRRELLPPPGQRRKTRRIRNRPRHIPGNGSAHSQPEHHEFQGRRAESVLVHQLRNRHIPRGPHGHQERNARGGARTRQRRNPYIPDPHFQGQGRDQLQPWRSQLRPVQTSYPCFGKAYVPEFLFH